MSVNKKKSSLGNNPLANHNPQSTGIFHPTEKSTPLSHNQKNIDSRPQNLDSIFLKASEKEKVNLRLPLELNDWLDDLVKKGKRLHGHKIPKEIWVQAALELFSSLSHDWLEVESIEQLQAKIQSLSSQLNQDS